MRHGCERTVFGLDLDGVRPFRIRRQRPHVFVCAGSVAYIPATVQIPVVTCVLCILCPLRVSKLQFWHRAARLRTHGFWLGVRWCSAFSHPLPPTSCFCLRRFGGLYTCYGPITCLDLCSVYTVYCVFERFRSWVYGFRSDCDGVRPFRSVANDLFFWFAQVRLLLYLLYLLRSTYLSCTVYFNTCYGPLTCLVLSILKAAIPATVH